LDKVQKDAAMKMHEAEENAKSEKHKAEATIKTATKMILEARAQKSEIKQAPKLAHIRSSKKQALSQRREAPSATWDFNHHPSA
jgi:hypothetical protein